MGEALQDRNRMGLALLKAGRYEEAARVFASVLAQLPTDRTALMGMGDTLGILGRPQGAQAAFEKLLACDPDDAPAHFGLGTILGQLGRTGEARRAFARAAALSPKRAAYHRALAEVARFTEDDPRLAALEALARDERSLPEDQKAELHFALAKAYDDLARYDEAFAHLKTGNALRRRALAYDENSVFDLFHEIAENFSRALIAARHGLGDPAEEPVFIVGMPRSGTSLVEQILASHPQAFGAGELTFVQDLIFAGHAGADYPADAAALSAETLRRFGALYAARLRALAPGARRIVDKLPANFRHLGLIHLALPGARILHVRRDPRDTCFSCYSKLFLSGLNYTYDLDELGRYHKAYAALMAHWRAALPEGAMLEVQYESLVENFAEEARRIVAFCGLDWDERCLDFHTTPRPVRTLSAQQVRMPLFKHSIGRWRRYEKHLGPLLDALA